MEKIGEKLRKKELKEKAKWNKYYFQKIEKNPTDCLVTLTILLIWKSKLNCLKWYYN